LRSVEHPVVRRLLDLPAAWPERQAFRSNAGSLTFAGLRDGMLRMAGWLAREHGVQPDDRVAICLPKSLEAVVTIYGVLASGAALVPLQFRGPPARLAATLAATRPRLLLTTAEMAPLLAGSDLPPVQTIAARQGGDGLEPLLAGVPASTTIPAVRPDDLAALFFTSGSTGDPKGVMLGHRTLSARITPLYDWDGFDSSDRLIIHTGLHYIACLDLFLPLTGGCSAFLLTDPESLFPDRIVETMARDGTTVWKSTSTTLRLLLEPGGLEQRSVPTLRQVIFVGEPLAPTTLRRLMAALPQAEFVQRFGATEAHRLAIYRVPRPLPDVLQALPLGEPADGFDLTLRDEAGDVVAPGDVGEICVVGDPVTLGYWNDPAATAARRLDGRPDSFRTGDLARLGADGLLYWAGRKDHVVKIRGHRLDLGEIEAALKAHPSVRDAVAVAVATASGDSEIHAAVLAAGDAGLDGELKRLCSERLTRFAWPARIAFLERFPLLSSGKVDRRTLQAQLAEG
jgi:amino acid adenylation domain-containing protein